MTDQLISGLPQSPQTAQSHAAAHRDQKASGQSADTGAEESFKDYVAKADQQGAGQNGRGGHGKVADGDADGGREFDHPAVRNVAIPAEAVLRGLTQTNEGRIQLTGHKHANKIDESVTTGKADAQARTGKDDDAQATVKVADFAKRPVQKAAAETANAAIQRETPASPSEELSMLLGLVPAKDETGKPLRKPEADAAEADGKNEKTAATAEMKPELLVAGQENAIAAPTNEAAPAKDETVKDVAKEAVRVVGADGKGRAIDVPLLKSGNDAVADTDKRSNGPKSETATVLEARRYLGFSTDTNTATLTGAIKSDATWTNALSQAGRVGLSLEGDTVREVNTLKLQMNPGDLGNMVASLKLKGDELTVEVRVETIDAYRQLSSDQDGIVKALQDQGFSIDKVTVQLSAAERTEAGGDRDLGRQNQGQGQKDAQGHQPGGRNDNNARQGNHDQWTRHDDAGIPTPSDGRTDPSRAGGDIYL